MAETFNAGTVAAYAKLDISGIVKGVAGAKASLQLYGDQAVAIITKSNASMRASMQAASTGMLAGGAAIAGGLALATKAAATFDQGMRNVNSIAKLSESQFQSLRGSVTALTNDPGIKDGPSALAKGLYDVYSSGFKGAEAINVLSIAAKGASAGMSDTATSGRALMAVLNSGISGVQGAQGAMDVLFKTVDLGVMTFNELAGSVGQILPTARAAGVSVQEIGAALATMTRQGQSASEASNDLLNVITKIMRPSEAAAKEWQKYGIESGAAALQSKGLAGVLAEVIQKTDGNAQALQNMFPDMQAFRGVMSLAAKDGGTFNEMLDGMKTAGDGAGATQGALNEQMKGAAFQFEKAKQAAEAFGIAIGTNVLPVITPLVDKAAAAVREFGKLPDGTKKAATEFALFAGAGLLVAGALGKVVGILQQLQPILIPVVANMRKLAEFVGKLNLAPVAALSASQGLTDYFKQHPLDGVGGKNMRWNTGGAWQPGAGGVGRPVSTLRVPSGLGPNPHDLFDWGDSTGGTSASGTGSGGGGRGTGGSTGSGRGTRTGKGAAQAAGGRLGGIYMDLYNQMQAWRAERLASMRELDDEWYDSVSGMFDDAIRHQQAADAEVASIAASWRETLDLMGGGIAEAFGIMGEGMASLNARQIGAQSFGIGAGFGSSLNSTITTLDTQQTGEAMGRAMMDQAQAIVGIADIVTRQMAEAHKRVLGTIGEIATSLTDTAWTTIHDATRQVFGDGRLAKGFAEGLSGMLQSSLATALENIDTWLSKTFGGTLGGILGIGVKLWAGGAFADGGTAPAGRWSLVGERGPEWIKPQAPTTVLPHGRAPGQVGQTSIQISFTGPVTMGSEADVNLLGDRLGWHVRQQLRASF